MILGALGQITDAAGSHKALGTRMEQEPWMLELSFRVQVLC